MHLGGRLAAEDAVPVVVGGHEALVEVPYATYEEKVEDLHQADQRRGPRANQRRVGVRLGRSASLRDHRAVHSWRFEDHFVHRDGFPWPSVEEGQDLGLEVADLAAHSLDLDEGVVGIAVVEGRAEAR